MHSYDNQRTQTGGSGSVNTGNSSTTLLTGGATFTGTWVDISDFSTVSTLLAADVDSAVLGFSMEFSVDGVTADRTKTDTFLTAEASSHAHVLSVIAQYFRVRYTNGSSAQASFRLQTITHKHRPRDITSGTEQVVGKHDDVTLVRVVNEPITDLNLGRVGYESLTGITGVNNAVGNGAYEVISDDGTVVHLTVATTIRVKVGGNVADTAAGAGARTIIVSGLDENFIPITDTITLAGASASSSTTNTYIRVLSASVTSTGTYTSALSIGGNVGNIVIENTAGTSDLSLIIARAGTTHNGYYTVAAGITAYLKRFILAVSDNNTLDLRACSRSDADTIEAPFTSVILFNEFRDVRGSFEHTTITNRKLLEKTDVWFEGVRNTGSGSALVTVTLDLLVVED